MAKTAKGTKAFSFAHDDPLAHEHRDVAEWVDEAFASLGAQRYYQDVDLKALPSGKRLLDAKGEQARRYVSAALAQTRYWEQSADRRRNQAEDEIQRANAHRLPGWTDLWGRRRQAEAVVRTLMKRKLPLTRQDVVDLLAWCNEAWDVSGYSFRI